MGRGRATGAIEGRPTPPNRAGSDPLRAAEGPAEPEHGPLAELRPHTRQRRGGPAQATGFCERGGRRTGMQRHLQRAYNLHVLVCDILENDGVRLDVQRRLSGKYVQGIKAS